MVLEICRNLAFTGKAFAKHKVVIYNIQNVVHRPVPVAMEELQSLGHTLHCEKTSEALFASRMVEPIGTALYLWLRALFRGFQPIFIANSGLGGIHKVCGRY